MHTDLSAHLHSEQCNDLIKLLDKCRRDNPFTKYIGKCNSEDYRMTKCLKEERLLRRKRNYEKSLDTKERLKKLYREEHERERQKASSN